MAPDRLRKTGGPNWADCATTDLDAAIAFYGAVFGWTAAREVDSTGAIYSIQRLDGKRVAGLHQLTQELRDLGVPLHWATYFGVADLDDALARMKLAGGSVVIEPFDLQVGARMAVVADPFGAGFEIMQSDE